LSVSSLLEASRGNIALANDLVDREVKAKFDPVKEEIAAARANLELVLSSPEYTQAEKKRALSALEIVGLKDRVNHKPKELSGGQQQRVAIARALANDPEVILADEPTGNLDSKTGKEIMGLFKDLNKEGKTIILITHDTTLIKYSKRIIKLADGKVVKK
jgi:putative ABC transport system ATP-binding protein